MVMQSENMPLSISLPVKEKRTKSDKNDKIYEKRNLQAKDVEEKLWIFFFLTRFSFISPVF